MQPSSLGGSGSSNLCDSSPSGGFDAADPDAAEALAARGREGAVGVGDLLNMTFREIGYGGTVQALMRVAQAEPFDQVQGFQPVRVEDALGRGPAFPWPDCVGWILLDSSGNLAVVPDEQHPGWTKDQFLPKHHYKYQILEIEPLDDAIAKGRLQRHQLRQERDAEEQAVAAMESQRIFAPSADYLRVIPKLEFETEAEPVVAGASSASGSALPPPAMVAGGSSASGSASPAPVTAVWDRVGKLPLSHLEQEAQVRLEEWRIVAFANNVFLQAIPAERDRAELHRLRKEIWSSWRKRSELEPRPGQAG